MAWYPGMVADRAVAGAQGRGAVPREGPWSGGRAGPQEAPGLKVLLLPCALRSASCSGTVRRVRLLLLLLPPWGQTPSAGRGVSPRSLTVPMKAPAWGSAEGGPWSLVRAACGGPGDISGCWTCRPS